MISGRLHFLAPSNLRPMRTWLALFGVLISTTSAVRAENEPSPSSTLAGAVPGDARIFIEIRDLNSFIESPSGEVLIGLIENFFGSQLATSQPAASLPSHARGPLTDWQRQLAHAVGITNEEAAVLLLGGRLALAADGWNGLDDAVLLAKPTDTVMMEKELEAACVALPNKLVGAAPAGLRPRLNPNIRRYKLSQDHELSCDGRVVVVGRTSSPSGLYTRTTGLWQSENGIALDDLADFAERTSALPQDRQFLLYITSGRRTGNSKTIAESLWPGIWPELKSFALSVTLTPGGVVVDTGGRWDPVPSMRQSCTATAESFSQLPVSTIAVWAQRINYIEEYRRINQGRSSNVLRFYLDVLQSNLAPGSIEQQLLAPLTGDSLFILGQTEYVPLKPVFGQEPLLLPAAALTIKTNNPEGTAQVLSQVAGNLLRLLNVQARTGNALQISETKLSSGDETIYSIPLGRFFSPRTKCEFLKTMTLSWTIADGWIVVATSEELIDKMVKTRRGLEPGMSPAGVVEDIRRSNGQTKVMMIAQPHAAGEMIDSWVEYLSRQHPQMLRADWWQSLQKKQRASSPQLGILAGPAQPGAVVVAQTLPNWPAHEKLQPGDRIISVDGHLLDSRNPQRSLQIFLNARADPTRVVLGIIRSDCEETVELTMSTARPAPAGPPPIELLRQSSDLLRTFSTANYMMWEPAPGLFNARLDLHFATTTADAQHEHRNR